MRVLVLFLSGCVLDLRIDEHARITCEDQTCPMEFTCRSGVCVHQDVDDFEPPKLTLVAVAPEVAKNGVEIAVTVISDEPLLAAPELRFDEGGGIATFTADPTDAVDRFVLRYTSNGSEQPGVHALLASAVDRAGNRTDGLLGGAVTFDFAPAAMVGAASFVFTTSADNPLPRASALTSGTELDVSFVSDELVVAPTLEAYLGATLAPIVFVRASGDGTGHVFSLDRAMSQLSDGVYELRATLVDPAGNSAVVVIGAFSVDTSAPSPPADSTLFQRRPWGDELGALPFFSLSGASGTVEPLSTVIAYADAAGEAELFRLSADARGAFGSDTTRVPTDDRSQLFLAAVDAAGNTSAIVPVRDQRWTAALAGNASSFTNPSSMQQLGRFVPHLLVRGSQPLQTNEAAIVDGTRLITVSDGAWRQLTTGNPANAAYRNPDLAFDFARGELMLRGGSDLSLEGQTGTEQWHLRNGHWERSLDIDVELDGEPDRGAGNLIVYDAVRAQILMLPDAHGVSWRWNGTSWKKLTQPAAFAIPPGAEALPSPTLRAAAVDPRSGDVVMLVGAPHFETWGFDGVVWTKRCGSLCAGPQPSTSFEMTTDEERKEILTLVDGVLWAYANGAWQQRHTCMDSMCPAARTRAAITYDHKRKRTVLYGGCHVSGCSQVYLDTWEWDGAAWSCNRPNTTCDPMDIGCNPEGSLPTCNRAVAFAGGGCVAGVIFADEPKNAYQASLAYDGNLEQVVLAGGEILCGVASKLWRWDGTAWTLLEERGPIDINAAIAFFDDTRALAVGGGPGPSGATWVWDGAHWTLDTRQPSPNGRANASLAYDPARSAVVLFGGEAAPATTWEWTLGGGWVERCTGGAPCSAQPTAFSGGALAYHPTLLGSLWVGAPDASDGDRNEVWLWKDGDWTRAPTGVTGPLVDADAAMAWDAQNARMVFHGGRRTFGTIDEYLLHDGTGWVSRGASTLREDHALVSDPVDGVARLFGGKSVTTCPDPFWDCNDLRRFTDTGFSAPELPSLSVAPVPGERSGHAAAASRSGSMIVTGGAAAEETSNGLETRFRRDTWLWQHPLTASPAHIFSAAFLAASAGSAASVQAIDVDWVVGATLAKTGATATVRLWIWDRFLWRPTSVMHVASAMNPTAFHWRSDEDPLWLGVDYRNVLTGETQAVHAAVSIETPPVTTVLGAGLSRHTLATDFASVSVRFRKP